MSDELITETDVQGFEPEDADSALTSEEWLAEFFANACCRDASTAARRLCGCGGSGSESHIPAYIKRELDELRADAAIDAYESRLDSI